MPDFPPLEGAVKNGLLGSLRQATVLFVRCVNGVGTWTTNMCSQMDL